MTKTVVGRPHIITENFDDISTYFGLIKCTVLPPRGLFHPVLQYRTQGKLMFPLCKTCVDTCNQAQRGIRESLRERLSYPPNARSVAFSRNLRRAIQGLCGHIPQIQARIQWLSQKLYHRGTETAVRRRILGSRRDTTGPGQERTQSWDACIIQTDVEFVLGYVFLNGNVLARAAR